MGLYEDEEGWPDLDRACMIEIRDPANISMLDPIERVALGMVGSSSNSPPLQVQEFQDEEGRIETMTDDQMYLMLGLGMRMKGPRWLLQQIQHRKVMHMSVLLKEVLLRPMLFLETSQHIIY